MDGATRMCPWASFLPAAHRLPGTLQPPTQHPVWGPTWRGSRLEHVCLQLERLQLLQLLGQQAAGQQCGARLALMQREAGGGLLMGQGEGGRMFQGAGAGKLGRKAWQASSRAKGSVRREAEGAGASC